MVLNEISAKFLGLPTLFSSFTLVGFGFMLTLGLLAICFSWKWFVYREHVDRTLFWVFGVLLIAFAVFRPIGLARDDLAYVQILNSTCPTVDCANATFATKDWIWYELIRVIFPYLSGDLIAALVVSGLGVLVKLIVIDQLCRQRLLALLLLIPLSFVQYDLTQLRAGLATSWMLLGILWLARSQIWLGSAALLTNLAVHFQAIFSPGLLMYRIFGLSRWVLPIGILALLGMVYGGMYPNAANTHWLLDFERTAPYYKDLTFGLYAGTKALPIGYLPILAYGVWLCFSVGAEHRRMANIIAASLFLAMSLAWLFVVIPTMQGRLFDFYVLPIVLLAGNVGASKPKILLTCIMAFMLYLRLELFNDWILG